MACYEIRLWVTIDQERAIIELFKQQSWTYLRLDSQYYNSYAYQSEPNTRLSSSYVIHGTNGASCPTQAERASKEGPYTEGQIRFDEPGGSFLSWLQNDVVTVENTLNKGNDSQIIENSSNTETHCDFNHEPELISQHHVCSENTVTNAENNKSNDITMQSKSQVHVDNLPLSVKNSNSHIDTDIYLGQSGNKKECYKFKQNDSQLADSKPNISLPPSSLRTQGIKPCGGSGSVSLLNINIETMEKEYEACKLNSAVVSESIDSQLNTKVSHTDSTAIGHVDNNNHKEQFTEYCPDANLDSALHKNLSEVNSPTLSKSEENSIIDNVNIVSETRENSDKTQDSSNINLAHEFSCGIEKLRNRLNLAVSRGKLKRKLEREIDELSKVESQFDKLVAIEAQVDRISKYKSAKQLCKRDTTRLNTKSKENNGNVKEATFVSPRSEMKLRNMSISSSKKNRCKVADKCEQGKNKRKCKQKSQSQSRVADGANQSNKDSAGATCKSNKESGSVNKRVDIYCQECEHTFKYKKNYDKHLEEDKCRHVCEFCGKIFLSGETGNYKIHLKYHNRQTDHECIVCGKQYVEFRKLKEHFRKHTGEAPYQCDECGLTFSGFSGLYSHKKTKHSGVQEQFCCSQCPKVFQRYSGLTFHMRYYHQAESDRPYSCSKCSKSFRTPDILKRHETTHRETRDYKCDQCSATFKRIQGLTEHKRRHVKDFGHFCSHCGKGFYTRQSRLVHERIHTGEKPYQCRLCPYSCALNGNLKKHMKTHNCSNVDCVPSLVD